MFFKKEKTIVFLRLLVQLLSKRGHNHQLEIQRPEISPMMSAAILPCPSQKKKRIKKRKSQTDVAVTGSDSNPNVFFFFFLKPTLPLRIKSSPNRDEAINLGFRSDGALMRPRPLFGINIHFISFRPARLSSAQPGLGADPSAPAARKQVLRTAILAEAPRGLMRVTAMEIHHSGRRCGDAEFTPLHTSSSLAPSLARCARVYADARTQARARRGRRCPFAAAPTADGTAV